MTPGEITRAIEARNKIRMIEAKEKAGFDYMLSGLIGKHISMILTGKGSMPPIEEVYPTIFAEEQRAKEAEIEQQKMNLSALRFKQFAQSYNNKFNKGGAKEDK